MKIIPLKTITPFQCTRGPLATAPWVVQKLAPEAPQEATQEAQDNILTYEGQGETSVSERLLPLDVRDFKDVNQNQQRREPAAQSIIFQQEVALYP